MLLCPNRLSGGVCLTKYRLLERAVRGRCSVGTQVLDERRIAWNCINVSWRQRPWK